LEKEFMKNYNVGSAVEVSDIVKPKEIENESLEENEQVDDDLDSIKSFFVKDN
jgi:cell division initiation protein